MNKDNRETEGHHGWEGSNLAFGLNLMITGGCLTKAIYDGGWCWLWMILPVVFWGVWVYGRFILTK